MAEPFWMRHLENRVGALSVRSHGAPARALITAGVLTVLGVLGSNQLNLVADLENLLPKTFASVRDLEPVKKRFGGIGYICVVGMGGNAEQLRRFADDFTAKVGGLPDIRYVDHKRAFKFFEERSLYYLALDDLKEVARRIKERERWERRQANPMFIKLDDEPAPSLDFSDIEARYGRRTDQRLAGSGEEYYLDEKKGMVVLMAKPAKTSSDLAFAQKVIEDTENFLFQEGIACTNCGKTAPATRAEVQERYGKDFKVGLTGTFKYKIDQQRQISKDIATSSLLAFLILVGYLLFHFRSFLSVGLVLAPVLAGLAWTYGLTWAFYGNVNVLTGFLGAILGGLGFEHGIHLLGRYGVLRGEGVSSEEAVKDAFTHTGGSAIVSSVVAALTFLAIAFSEFRAFREFGLISSTGMLVIISSYVLILPPLLGVATRLGWSPKAHDAVAGTGSELARWLPRYRKSFAAAVAVMLVYFFFHIPGIRFDYDFHSLEDSSLPSFELDREVNKILGYSQEPVVILTEKNASERAIVAEIKSRQEKKGAATTVDFVAALDDLVPAQQVEKKVVLGEIARILDKVPESKLDADTRSRFDRLLRWVKAEPFTRPDIPMSVRRQFEGVGGFQEGGFVLIFPNIKLSDGKAVREFAKEVRGIQVPGGDHFSAAGEAMILADVLEMVIRESPPILAGAILAVLLAMWLTLGSLRLALLCMTPTVTSILAMVGFMSMADLPFNYLNILIVPVLVGTTVDAGVHLVGRWQEHGDKFPEVFAETGRAICGGLLTSAVGFGALLLADHPGLNSLGRLANLGFAVNLLVMIVGFPALLLTIQRFLPAPATHAEPVPKEAP